MPGAWAPLTHQPPATLHADSMLLLTDGSVLVHDAHGAAWMRLSPDERGEYTSGTWSPVRPMAVARQFFASGLLVDGRVFVIGGEDSSAGRDTPLGEIFDPRTGAWTALPKPTCVDFIRGDASCCVLCDGRVLLGGIQDARTALWDPATGVWREAGTAHGTRRGTKVGRANEETWTLLPDGSVLTVEVWNPGATEKYLPDDDVWVSAGATPENLRDDAMKEIGPALLLPDGRAFAVGGSGHTALYSPPLDPSQPGRWTNAVDLRDRAGNPLTAIDAPAVLLPSGKVLVCAGQRHAEPGGRGEQYWSGPQVYLEYDPVTNVLAETPSQPAGLAAADTWKARLLLLPSGQVLATGQQSQVWIYTPDGAPADAWRPRVAQHPSAVQRGEVYEIEGLRFNGMSQAVSYGDDYTAATNYPLVQLRNGSEIAYCATRDISLLGVATGPRLVRARFQVPASAPAGDCELRVVANGIASAPVHVHVA